MMQIVAALKAHAERLEAVSKAELLGDETRNSDMVWSGAGLVFDARRQRLDIETLDLLRKQALSLDAFGQLSRLYQGEISNPTEGRPVLHPACRNPDVLSDPALSQSIKNAQSKTGSFSAALANPEFLGGHPVKRIVNIGIGGSDLGPRFVYDALKAYRRAGMDARFVSNLDPADLDDALEGAEPESTLVLMVSKSFTTQETMMNARAARAWLSASLSEDEVNARFVAATSAPDKAKTFGLTDDQIFPFEGGVGGRYSLWSPAGLSLELVLGPEVYADLLNGAKAMDEHAVNAPADENLALNKALIDVWNRTYRGLPARCVAAYSSRLERLPSYLQQLEMESLGKSVKADGKRSEPLHSGALVWGGRGSDLQHSVFQWLHQGQDEVPVDFIAITDREFVKDERARALNANLAAQGAALSQGRIGDGDQAAHKAIAGGRASSTILMPKLDPYHLGSLIALHEHKVFFESVLFGSNAYDQYGVELGKQLANAILSGDAGPLDGVALQLAEELGVKSGD
jgi:glucose-6-phosphate isomerase